MIDPFGLALADLDVTPTLLAASGWTPAALSPVVWLKKNTLLFSDDGVTPVVDNDPIYRWGDSSGNGFHAKQATLGNRPIYSGGNQWCEFDGVSNYLTITSSGAMIFGSNSPRAMIFVLQEHAASSNGVLASRGSGVADEFRMSGTTRKPSCLYFASPNTVATATTALTLDTTYMVSANYTNGNQFVAVNNTIEATDATYAGGGASANLTIGGRGGALPNNMRLIEFLLIPSTLTQSALDNLKAYYGL